MRNKIQLNPRQLQELAKNTKASQNLMSGLTKLKVQYYLNDLNDDAKQFFRSINLITDENQTILDQFTINEDDLENILFYQDELENNDIKFIENRLQKYIQSTIKIYSLISTNPISVAISTDATCFNEQKRICNDNKIHQMTQSDEKKVKLNQKIIKKIKGYKYLFIYVLTPFDQSFKSTIVAGYFSQKGNASELGTKIISALDNLLIRNNIIIQMVVTDSDRFCVKSLVTPFLKQIDKKYIQQKQVFFNYKEIKPLMDDLHLLKNLRCRLIQKNKIFCIINDNQQITKDQLFSVTNLNLRQKLYLRLEINENQKFKMDDKIALHFFSPNKIYDFLDLGCIAGVVIYLITLPLVMNYTTMNYNQSFIALQLGYHLIKLIRDNYPQKKDQCDTIKTQKINNIENEQSLLMFAHKEWVDKVFSRYIVLLSLFKSKTEFNTFALTSNVCEIHFADIKKRCQGNENLYNIRKNVMNCIKHKMESYLFQTEEKFSCHRFQYSKFLQPDKNFKEQHKAKYFILAVKLFDAGTNNFHPVLKNFNFEQALNNFFQEIDLLHIKFLQSYQCSDAMLREYSERNKQQQGSLNKIQHPVDNHSKIQNILKKQKLREEQQE